MGTVRTSTIVNYSHHPRSKQSTLPRAIPKLPKYSSPQDTSHNGTERAPIQVIVGGQN